MNKFEISENKLDRSETFFSSKNMKLYNLTEENPKNFNETNIDNNLKLTKNIRGSNETFAKNLYGNVTNVINLLLFYKISI
jgi:hypothetical protein